MKTIPGLLFSTLFIAAAAGFQPTLAASEPLPPKGFTKASCTLRMIPSCAVHHPMLEMPRTRIRESTSGNWSGYAAPRESSGVSDTFASVEGTWVVPTVTGASRSAAYSSAWVGLDGYESATVEQIGTEQDWNGTRQQNYVWFEMYPAYAYEIVGFPINPGDSISGVVEYVTQTSVKGPGAKVTTEYVFQMEITNLTRKVYFIVPLGYTTTPTAARASAEWVMEAPTGRSVLPLANFGTAQFSACSATSRLSSGGSKPISFWPDDPLTMVDSNGGKATPSALGAGGAAFSVKWSQ